MNRTLTEPDRNLSERFFTDCVAKWVGAFDLPFDLDQME